MNTIIEIIEQWGGLAGKISAMVAFLIIFQKPLKKIISVFVKWINAKVGSETQNKKLDILESGMRELDENFSNKLDEAFGALTKKLDTIIEEKTQNDALLKTHSEIHLLSIENRITNLFYKYANDEYIPAFEINNLINHYELYNTLGGTGKMTKMYDQLMAKKIKGDPNC